MTRNGDWTYIWDAENRLVEARPATTNLGSSLVQYMYDAQSRRIARREFVWSDYLGDTTWHYVQGRAYLYDGWNQRHKNQIFFCFPFSPSSVLILMTYLFPERHSLI